jgi:cytochrome c2
MPSSLRWLLALVLLALGTAILSGAVLYLEDRRSTGIHAQAITGGNVEAGRTAIERVGCGTCHVIPGIGGATGRVGPPLGGIATRAQIAGILPNDPRNLQRWITTPQAVLPGNGMPDQPVTSKEARDISAYLYTLKR